MKRKYNILVAKQLLPPQFIDSPRTIEFLLYKNRRRTNIYGYPWKKLYKGAKIRLCKIYTHGVQTLSSYGVQVRTLPKLVTQTSTSKSARINMQPAQKWAGSFVHRLNTRLKRPITLREALIIALVVWIFVPLRGHAQPPGDTSPFNPYKVPVLTKPLPESQLQPVSEIAPVVVAPSPAELPRTSPVSAYSGSLAKWLSDLRSCESGGNYQINTGNSFYGAYQFTIPTWNHWNTGYARADLAPPAVQDATIIENTLGTSGLSTQNPGCYAKMGLSNYPPSG